MTTRTAAGAADDPDGIGTYSQVSPVRLPFTLLVIALAGLILLLECSSATTGIR